MRKLLLFALLFSGIIASAQTSNTGNKCKAQFKYEVNNQLMSPVASTAMNFYDQSEGNVTFWYWDFGDGSTSTDQNPFHNFNPISIPGTTGFTLMSYRVVSLTILTSDSCKSFYADTIKITNDSIPGPAKGCKAGFKYYPSDFDSINGTASFQMTNLSGGDSLSYLWNFDNQSISTEKEPTITFDLSQPERKVCLTISRPGGCSDLFCDLVNVYKPNPNVPTAKCSTSIGYKVNYQIQTFAPALALDFYAKSEPEAIGWNWDFGDGTVSDQANPTHLYNLPLSKDSISSNPYRTVTLTVKTDSGCVATNSESINIYMNGWKEPNPTPQCHAWFKYFRPTDVVSVPEVIPFRLVDVSEGNVISRLWKFEDGTTSTDSIPLVNFDAFKSTQKVCLTIFTADSCSSSWCETIYLSALTPDTSHVSLPSGKYNMHITSSFPIQMSSCAGYAKAQVFWNDSLINASDYSWSTGDTGQELKGLCPTRTYSVKAIAPDGQVVWCTFVFNSDGTVTEIPVNWWISGESQNPYVKCNPGNSDYTVEWKLCDGTTYIGDSISLSLINCTTNQSNLILRDGAGNVIYSETVSVKSLLTGLNKDYVIPMVKIYPNPVKDVLNIQYSGETLNVLQIEIFDISGKQVLQQRVYNVESGQNISLNMYSLKTGIFICKLMSGKQMIASEKFIK